MRVSSVNPRLAIIIVDGAGVVKCLYFTEDDLRFEELTLLSRN